jgi:gluconate 2-dehydrogenase gamma chain
MNLRRRDFLATTACLLLNGAAAKASVIQGHLPWLPNAGDPPEPVKLGSWLFFSGDEARAVEAIADRIIPPDPDTAGGKDAGCAVFVDRQLAGSYGRGEGLYHDGPFMPGKKQQGPQSKDSTSQKYRDGISALNRYCHSKYGDKDFADLSDEQKDDVLHGLEKEEVKLEGAKGKEFFEQIIKDVQQGFFADPIYGGNRNMVSWKMIGYPGARYNYLDWIDRHNERYPLPPVSIAGRADWTPKQ